jgi:hypothetical protein
MSTAATPEKKPSRNEELKTAIPTLAGNIAAAKDGLGAALNIATAVGGSGSEALRDLIDSSRVDELERHLDAIAVGLVEDELAAPDEGLALGVECTRVRRVGDLLDTYDDVHGRQSAAGYPPVTNWVPMSSLAFFRGAYLCQSQSS